MNSYRFSLITLCMRISKISFGFLGITSSEISLISLFAVSIDFEEKMFFFDWDFALY
jgi:hypothetical protein